MKIKASYIDFFFVTLTFACQIWTIKFGLLSLPILVYGIMGTAAVFIEKKIEFLYLILILVLSFSLALTTLNDGAGIFHYSYYFGIITIFFIFIFFYLAQAIREKTKKDYHSVYFLAILLAIGFVILKTPEKLLIASDGNVGLFNEKGLFSYYITLMAGSYWFIKRNLLSVIFFVMVLIYCSIIQEATRAILPFIAVILVFLKNIRISLRVIFISILFIFLALFFFMEPLIYKLNIALNAGGVDGRNAAVTILIEQGLNNLYLGNGFHSYLGNRWELLPMPGDFPYDYPGSMLLELIYEVGIPLTVIIVAVLTKVVFGKVSLFGMAAVLSVVISGGKQDILMWYTLIVLARLNKHST
ncbi:hypothetical protein [Polynucleobacter acidiphobus]|uniref:hypothetical protein n=1 Tax=Polynucleobacter acidiphobus TaxID=556053 RepID=UPI000D33169F|nr:hypothetical protein [Polynucleobacter acidiphobus]